MGNVNLHSFVVIKTYFVLYCFVLICLFEIVDLALWLFSLSLCCLRILRQPIGSFLTQALETRTGTRAANANINKQYPKLVAS